MKSPACSRACCGNEAASRQRRETAIESCSPACCGPCRQASRTRSAPCKPAGRLPGAVARRASPPGDFPEPLQAVQARRATSRSRCTPRKPFGRLPEAAARRADRRRKPLWHRAVRNNHIFYHFVWDSAPADALAAARQQSSHLLPARPQGAYGLSLTHVSGSYGEHNGSAFQQARLHRDSKGSQPLCSEQTAA